MTCFDLAFLGWVVRRCHILLYLYPSLFLHFLLHPFIIHLIPFSVLLSSSIVVSLHERWVLWCMSPIVCFLFGCRVESPCSHDSVIFGIAYKGLAFSLMGIWAFVFHHFIHYSPLPYIMVRVIRSPWGHEISCLLWRNWFGQAPSTDWVWDVDRSPLLRGISTVTYCLSI